jgi:adenylate cyclase
MANPENSWLKGVRSNVTVVFTDVRGFTSYSEQHDPEAVVEALNGYFDIATRHIVEHGGYVDKFIGDAVMGVFGVPVAREDHAEQAVRASLSMQEEFARAAAETGNQLLARVGIGINTGFAVSGNIGSQEKMEYTVIGDAVNVASRLNGLAAAGETIISASVRQALGRALSVEPRPAQKVKGKAEPIPVYRVLGIAQAKAPKTPNPEAPDAQPTTA